MKLADIKPNPDNPRLIKTEKYKALVEDLRKSTKLLKYLPLVIDTDSMIIVGNQRLAALKEIGVKELSKEYVLRAEDLSPEELEELIIKSNLHSGEWDWDILANRWDSEFLRKQGLEVPSAEEKDKYIKSVKAPIYLPADIIPELEDLVDTEKGKELLEEIEKADISPAEKEFLKKATYRHYVFNYSKVADYYSNANKEMQLLMEKSALVIIDFEKAIENGFVVLSDYITAIHEEEYED